MAVSYSVGLVYASFSSLHTYPQVHRPRGNIIPPLSDQSLYLSDPKYFSCIECSTSVCITLGISKIISHVLASHTESRGSNQATHFLAFLAGVVPPSNTTSTSDGWRVAESGNSRPSYKERGEKKWQEEAHPERVWPAHWLWYVTLGLRKSSVWIILQFFKFCSHTLSHHHHTLIFMPIKSYSEWMQHHQQCSVRTPLS